MSKTYLRGSKRLSIIQNWLNGKDDDDWEVLPTKKDGKYIVRERQSMPKPAKTSKKDLQVPQDNNTDNNDNTNDNDNNESDNVPIKRVVPQQQTIKHIKSKHKNIDPTVNLQILEQLKLLGSEIKYERERKQQKQLIKNQINKQLNKSQPQQIIYTNPEQQKQSEPEPQPQPQQPQQYIPKRRRLDLRNI